jgi:cyclic pyranopterin phosphate synthase
VSDTRTLRGGRGTWTGSERLKPFFLSPKPDVRQASAKNQRARPARPAEKRHRNVTMLSSGAMFGFEEHDPGLELIPLAARRALDASGVKLSLDGWRALELAARRALVESGAAEQVPVDRVRELVGRLTPSPERVDPCGDPAEISDDLRRGLDGGLLTDLERAWGRLSGLERYTLAKVARPGHLDPPARRVRLLAAFDEIVRRLSPSKGAPAHGLSHLTAGGDAHMVNVGAKPVTERLAVAGAFVTMQKETLELLLSGRAPKGDVLAAARIAGIQAAKRTPTLIPLCHAVALTSVEVELEPSNERPGMKVTATARALDRTGVEMEALVAASIASLTLYDMLKAVDRGMTVTNVELLRKAGGRSGDYQKGQNGRG